jgi:hypothetical protein
MPDRFQAARSISCSPWVGLTLESMSSTMPFGGRRPCTRSIHWPDRAVRGQQVLLRRQPTCLEAPHLTWRCRLARSRLAADDPAYRRITAQAIGVVDILVSGKPPEHRLPQQPDQRMAAIPAGACIGQHVPGHGAETERVVEFTIGQQSGIGGDPAASRVVRPPRCWARWNAKQPEMERSARKSAVSRAFSCPDISLLIRRSEVRILQGAPAKSKT